MIVENEAKAILKDFPSEVLITLYAIGTYHEKYRFTGWVMEILSKRGVDKADMQVFDENFKGFYYDLLNQEGL